MGVFHCPFGCLNYEEEGCIDCRLCTATTEAEMVAASKRIRAYLKAHALPGRPIQKIAVCGKGGTGKSTLVTLMARALVGLRYRVAVLDTDESNPGLYRCLGFTETPKGLNALMTRFSYTGTPGQDTHWIMLPEIRFQDIHPAYFLERDGIRFFWVGKIEEPFQGCACGMADVCRGLVQRWRLEADEVLLIDTEAGVESFGRGVERSVDLILAVVEPSFEAMALAEKIVYLAEGMGINRVGALLNKVPSETVKQRMHDELTRRNVPVLGAVSFDPRVQEAGFEGTRIPDSEAGRQMKDIMELLINMVQMTAG